MSDLFVISVLTDGINPKRGSLGAWIRNIDAEEDD